MMNLLCLGYGFSAAAFARSLPRDAWSISGTARSAEKCAAIEQDDVTAIQFDGVSASDQLRNAVASADQIVISIAPGEDGDPVLNTLADDIANAPRLAWIGYLSTIGVYGDHQGEWIDETAPLRPVSPRALRRVRAERDWLAFGEANAKPVMIFRLAGIYGPGRSPLTKLRNGTSRRVIKEGQVFNRIHTDDIAATLRASLERPNPGAVYNVTDDNPVPPQEVIEYGARLLDMSPPPPIPFDTAEMTPMARSFYGENKRCENLRIKQELGITLKHPTYKEGLAAVLEAEAGDS